MKICCIKIIQFQENQTKYFGQYLLCGLVKRQYLQIIHKLMGPELKKVLKVDMIRPRVFVMAPGSTMFVTGLARIDYLAVSN